MVILGLGLAGCGSSAPQSKALPHGTASSTVSVAPAALNSSASATPGRAASPAGTPCPKQPGTEFILADGIGTVGSAFAVTGYVETAYCGPGVVDDVEYRNTGAHRSFALPAGVKVELLGSTPSDQHTATLADLETLLRIAFPAQSAQPTAKPTPNGSMLWSHYFELTLSSNGRITGITSMYHP